jgi:hypothetical protein
MSIMKTTSLRRISGRLAASLLAAALITPIAQAQTWNNWEGDNNFANPSNWSTETVPTTNSGTIFISIGGDSDGAKRAIYNATVGDGTFGRLRMGVDGSTPARFDIPGGKFLTNLTGGSAETRIAAGSRQVTINQGGAGSEFSFGNFLRLRLNPNSVDTYNLSGGSLHVYRNVTTNNFVASVVLGRRNAALLAGRLSGGGATTSDLR